MKNNKPKKFDLSLKNYYQKSKLAKENNLQINEKNYLLFLKDILRLIRKNGEESSTLYNLEQAIFHELDLNLFNKEAGVYNITEYGEKKINQLNPNTLKILKNEAVEQPRDSLTAFQYATQAALDNESSLREQADNDIWETIETIIITYGNHLDALDSDKQNTLVNGNYTTISGNQVNVTDSELGIQINTVQDDYGLATTAQTIVGAISELKAGSVPDLNNYYDKPTTDGLLAGKQNNLGNGNYTTISGNQVNVTDALLGTQINTVQDDYVLNTTAKTIVGAINELQAGEIPDLSNYYDKPETDALLVAKQNTLVNGNYTTISGNQVNVTDATLGTQINTVQNNYSLATTAQTIKGAIGELVNSVATSGSSIALKQNITDNTLNTTNKTVAGAINEVKTTADNATSSIALKQNINEPTLNTTSKTIPGAINEVKGINDTQTTNITANTTAIAGKQNTLVNGNYTTISGNQVNVADSALGTQIINVQSNYQLQTQAQTINGAIEELGDAIANNQTSIFTLTNSVNLKQNINEPTLNTISKTIPGGINEVVNSVANLTTALAGKQNTLAANGNFITVSGNTVNVTDATLGTKINTVQANYTLATTAQTVKGAIAEIVGKIPVWTQVGVVSNAKTISFAFTSGTRYRLRYNWETSTTTANPIFKEFIYTSGTTVLDAFLDGFNGVKILEIVVLGSANVAQILLSSSGINISARIGSTPAGNLIMLEQYTGS